MKNTKPPTSSGFKPFEDLKDLLATKSIPLISDPKPKPKPNSPSRPDRPPAQPDPLTETPDDPETDQALFLKAMADVVPLEVANCAEPPCPDRFPEAPAPTNEAETLIRLENLVKRGEGFVVADTPEYVEGTGHRIHPEIAKRLHRGQFSIQGHLDLHGLRVEQAQHAFEVFLRKAIQDGKRMVLIIHGRGLSSPAGPVLKKKVGEWLTSGPWRKWIIAFSSARRCDGGAGATYILLRRRPVTKRFRKKNRLKPW